ncbi:serine hydrolase domain-containing protein [Nigerium massiliense]|uniref:serine hydrolase domain-containing protein n=1 Tax=Nigerium massiliense TaxID=1522317 RepID=UPI000A896245|nr:serine hydrolase domain-containing protein [Nigerium massiliense]
MTMVQRLTAFASAVVLSLSALAGVPADAAGVRGRFDQPQQGFMPATTRLREGTPARAKLDPAPIEAALAQIEAVQEPSGSTRPLQAGSVVLMAHDGIIAKRRASGYAVRYADGSGTELPPAQRVAMRPDTIFDMASVSKLFTSIAVVQLLEERKIELEAPVARYLPEFGNNGKQAITVRQLLTHTSGLVSWLPLYSQYPDKASRIKAVMDTTPTSAPGTTYLYSDLNLITLGVLVEKLRGRPLDRVVEQRIARPLGMTDTGYNPRPDKLYRVAATEYAPVNPGEAPQIIRGLVHDENARSLGGVAGHAGVFSTAEDMAVLSQTLLNGGAYAGKRILKPASVELMITNFNKAFPGDAHGLGFELDQRWYMAGLSSLRTAGHTGFTGPSLVIDFASRSIVVVLANRVHPSRNWGSNNPVRRAAAQGLALALAVKPAKGRTAWFTGVVDGTTSTLTTDVDAATPATLTFQTFVDTDESDKLFLERSADDGKTWTAVPFELTLKGVSTATDGSYTASGLRQWQRARAVLAAGRYQLRWRVTTDAIYLGRGVYVDDIRIAGANGRLLLNGEGQPERLVADGWTAATR